MLAWSRALRLRLGLGLGAALAGGCTAFGADEDGPPVAPSPPAAEEAGADAEAGSGDDASTADGGTADGGCTWLPFADGFEADFAASGWSDLGGNAALDRVTERKHAGTRSLRVIAPVLASPGLRRRLEREIAPAGCEAPSRLEMRLHLLVTEITGEAPSKGARFLSLEFASTRVFVKVEPGPRLVVREQQGGNPASLLADLPLTLEKWTEVRLTFDAFVGPASQKIAFRFDGDAIDLPPLALAHEDPQRIVLGAAYVDDTARARFYIDGFEAK